MQRRYVILFLKTKLIVKFKKRTDYAQDSPEDGKTTIRQPGKDSHEKLDHNYRVAAA
jgi:hypothetical protein